MSHIWNTTEIVAYDGQCAVCGTFDGMVQRGSDGRFRVICRRMGCPAYYLPSPHEGYPRIEDTVAPFDSELLSHGCTVERYLRGERRQ